MKSLLLCLMLALAGPADSLKVMFWNLENYFDWRNDSTSVADAEFSSQGARRWTRKRFYAKTNAIAKAILWASSSAEGVEASGSDNFPGTKKGPMSPESHHLPSVNGVPDIIGLAEVENAFVLRRLLDATALRKLDYRIVHFESPDPRGIDVALLYRSSRLELLDARPCHLYAADSTVLATRDILLARFIGPEGGDIAFLVNHHPSKYGGVAVSEPRRQIAVRRLKELADSLQGIGLTHILAMGDMNDTPANPVYKRLEPTLVNLAEPLYRQGEGTIKYDGAWELIDMFFASSATNTGPMKILRIPFLTTQDTAHAGTKPLRTYSGPGYLGGVSDHCPIIVTLYL